jgi:hypothetical protein
VVHTLPRRNSTERRTHILLIDGHANFAAGGREGLPLVLAGDNVRGGNVGLELANGALASRATPART